MRILKYKNIFIYLIIFSGFILKRPVLINASQEQDISTIINLEYLEKIPSEDYIIGPGDELSISVSRSIPELTDVYLVNRLGTISLPNINTVHVKGLTPNELADLLNRKYLETVKSPNVKVELTKYRSVSLYIDGEIENPGFYTLPGSSMQVKQQIPSVNDTSSSSINSVKVVENSYQTPFFEPTLFDVIRKAGGITRKTDLRNIQVIRNDSISNGGGKKIARIDYTKLIEYGDTSYNIRVYDGDSIRLYETDVPIEEQISKAIKSNLNPKFIKVAVTGRVQAPGIVNVNKAGSLNDAITLAGGPKILKGKVNYVSYNSDGSIDSRSFRYNKNAERGHYSNPYLNNGDIIRIGNSGLNVANEIITEVTAPIIGIGVTYSLFNTFNSN